MSYRAKMQDGTVVFEGGIKPADGVELRVDIVVEPDQAPSLPVAGEAVGQRMLKYAGMMTDPGLPKDGARHHDHYIYGTPGK